MNYIINLFNHYGYLVLLVSLALELIALSFIFFNIQYPSDIAAGFEWLSLSIILLETFSVLPRIRNKNTAT